MKTKLLLLSVFFLVSALAFISTASADIPHLMNYQGKATDKSGAPLNGTYNLTFRIYNSETGGIAKWSETQPNIPISNGIFQVQLGSVTSLNLPFDESYWISIEINSDGEMSPRTRLASVPYAYKAEAANNSVPTGVIMAWTTDSPPAGWLICNGAAISRATYTNLFAIIGTTYGSGDGVSTFNLPNLQGRVAVGKSTEMEFMALGQKGGEKTHSLTIAEMPAHAHYDGISDDQNTHFVYGGTSAGMPGSSSRTLVNEDTPCSYQGNTSSVGGNGVHNNLQPYITLNYIIKT